MKNIVLFLLFILNYELSNSQEPTFKWAKQVGGNADDWGKGISVDRFGNVYSTGFFADTVDFDPGSGVYPLWSSGYESDCFITKLDSSGNFKWAKQIGGIDNDYGYSISSDKYGNVYIAGMFVGVVDFNPDTGTFNLSSCGKESMFILKLNTKGDFLWARNICGTYSIGRSIEIDFDGNVYTVGDFIGVSDFDPGIGIYNLSTSATKEIFISKLDSNGNFVWAKQLVSTDYSTEAAITLDKAGNIYIIGLFYGLVDFDPGVSSNYLSPPIGMDASFVLKLLPNGNFSWVKKIDKAWGYSITTDENYNVISTGSFIGMVDFNPNIGTNFIDAGNSTEVYILKLDSAGNYKWAINFLGNKIDEPRDLITDKFNNIYIIGAFQDSIDFDLTSITDDFKSKGMQDVFISKLDESGKFIWATQFGGDSSWSYGISIALDDIGNVFATGNFKHTVDFNPSNNVFNLKSFSNVNDVFILKMYNNTGRYNGISKALKSKQFYVSPIPCSRILNIEVANPNSKMQIEIVNSIGEIVYLSSDIKKLNVVIFSEFAPAVYYMRLIDNGELIGSQKIISQ